MVHTSCGVSCLAALMRALSRFLPGIRSQEESIFAMPHMVFAMCCSVGWREVRMTSEDEK